MNALTIDVLNGFTHKDYNHVVKNAHFYRQIVTGIDYGALIVNYKPRESDKQKIQRVRISMNRTKCVAGKVKGFFKRTFRADKLVFEVKHEDTAKSDEIRPFVDSYGNDGQSLLKWSEYSALFYNNLDPNALYWVRHSRQTVDNVQVDSFEPIIFTSRQVKIRTIKKGLIVDCVCELSETVRYVIKSTNKLTSKTIKILYTFTLKGLELSIELNKEVLDNSNFYDQFTDENGQFKGEKEKHNDITYLVIFEESEIDVLPVSRMGYNLDDETEGRTYVPFWDNASEEYKILANDGSVFDVSKNLHGFPMKFEYYTPCNFVDSVGSGKICKDGKLFPGGADCNTCNGTGKIVHISAQDVVEVRMPTEDMPQMVKPSDMAAYVKQPTESLEMQKTLVDEATQKITECVFGVDLSHQQTVQATATQISNYYDTAQDTLFEFTIAPTRIFKFTVQTMAKYLEIEGVEVALVYTNEYNLESEEVLILNLKTAKDAAAPPVIIDSITDRIIEKQNRNNSSFLALHKAINRFKPFGDVGKELINSIVQFLPDSSVQKALYLNFKEIVADVDATDKLFLTKKFSEQKKILDAKALIFANAAVLSSSVREITGLNMTDDQAPQDE